MAKNQVVYLPWVQTDPTDPIIMAASSKMLAARNISAKDLSARLEQQGFEAAAIAAELERLISDGLINDTAYAKRIIEKNSRRYSLAIVKSKLVAAGIPQEVIESLLAEESGESELSQIETAIAKAIRQGKVLSDANDRRKVMASLQRKGYRSSTILQAINEAETQNTEVI